MKRHTVILFLILLRLTIQAQQVKNYLFRKSQ